MCSRVRPSLHGGVMVVGRMIFLSNSSAFGMSDEALAVLAPYFAYSEALTADIICVPAAARVLVLQSLLM